jgi:hypothetical protein
LSESDAIAGQGVDCGGLDLGVSVTTNVISAQSIDRNEKDIGVPSFLLGHAAECASTPNAHENEAKGLHLYGE